MFPRQIWDTAGQERFHSLTTSFFKRAEGFVLVYDVSNRQSFESVSQWMKDIVEVGAEAEGRDARDLMDFAGVVRCHSWDRV